LEKKKRSEAFWKKLGRPHRPKLKEPKKEKGPIERKEKISGPGKKDEGVVMPKNVGEKKTISPL